MALRKFFVDLDLQQNKLKNATFETVDTGVAGFTNQVGFNSAGKLVFYNSSTSAWEVLGEVAVDTVNYKGAIAANATAPASPNAGDMYVFSSGGALTWTGAPANTVVQQGDFAIYSPTSSWDIIQGNIIPATTTEAGVAALATQGDVNSGTGSSTIVTPATLEGYRQNKKVVQSYTVTGQAISTTPGTSITHGLNTTALQVTVYDSNGAQIEVAVVVTDASTVTLTSNSALTNTTVVVQGFKA